MALSLATTVVLFWIPYCMKGCKNVQHHCGNANCDALLATWHRAPSPGNIEVHAFN
jgi:LITAF-like zinc ribbon domain